MTQLNAAQIERTIETCREHLAELAETFHKSLDLEMRLSAGEPIALTGTAALADLGVPGLAVVLGIGSQGLIVLVPESLPLPGWYRQPDIAQNNRLQTLAHELSLQLLPADLQSDRYLALATENLAEVVERAQADASAQMVELSVFHPDGTHDASFAKILLIVPVNAPPLPAIDQATSPDFAAAAVEDAGASAISDNLEDQPGLEDPASAALDEEGDVAVDHARSAANALAAARSADAALRALRILQVPVTVSVRLAERKMSLGSVVGLVPGSLVTFTKSCEDLLDLYVNNHRYCQGEAVKIGESFGLKVSKVAVAEERKERII
jgi:flagellar motor switch protein FliN